MRPIVFLFGAGASYGAGGIAPEPPPLGFQLYRELKRSYPGSWGRLPEHIGAALEEDFEKGMRRIYDEIGGAIPQLMREMAVYFIQFRPVNRSSLYCRLLRHLQQEKLLQKTILSTLNYECVLDFSIAGAGRGLSYFDEGQHNEVPLWKLHGSCNMFSEGVQAGQGVTYGVGVTWEGGIRALATADAVIQHCLVETGLAPVMSLYMEGKPLSVSPSAIKQLQAKWAAAVSGAETVCCIGVRPLAADGHIWGPIFNADARVLFIGDEQAMREWAEGRAAQTDFLGSRFNESFLHLLAELRNHAN